jgi:hypothetical protein
MCERRSPRQALAVMIEVGQVTIVRRVFALRPNRIDGTPEGE